MPTGTRRSISTNRTRKPRTATASVLMPSSLDRLDLVLPAHQFRLEDQAIGAHGNQQHCGDVAKPGHQKKRPGRQSQVESEHVVSPCGDYLVEQSPGLHRDHEQQDEGGEYVDEALQLRPDIRIEEIDRDVGPAVRRGGDTPEDQNAEKKSAEIVAVWDLNAEEIPQQNRDED